MKSRLLREGPPQVCAVVFDTDDTFHSGLADWAAKEDVGAASFTAVGAFKEATLGYYDPQEQSVRRRHDDATGLALIDLDAEGEGAPRVGG